MSGGGDAGRGLREPGPGSPPDPRRPGGALGRSRGRGRLRRPGDDAPRACGEAVAALSQSGEPWGARAAGRSEAGVRGEAGFAARLLRVCTHTLAHACCLTRLTHSDPSFAPRGQGRPEGGPGGGGKTRGCGDG